MVLCGGASRSTELVARYQNRPSSAFDAAVAWGMSGPDEDELAVPPETAQFVIPDLVREISPARDARALKQIREVIREYRPVVVNTHSSKAGVLGRMAARREGVPVAVHHVHGWSFHDEMTRLRRFLTIALERRLARGCDALFFDARRDIATAQRYNIGRDGHRHVLNTIEVSRFDPATDERRAAARKLLRIPNGRFVVGTVAQMRPQKAPLDFVEVAQQLKGRTDEVLFVWIGDGPMRGEVTQAVAQRGLADSFVFAGSREDVSRLYCAFDLFLLTSLWEGLPRTVVEASIVGVPVVATSVPGTAEAIIHRETGMLAPPHDTKGLADCIMELKGDAELCERVRRNAAHLRDEFSIEKAVVQLERTYLELLEAKKV